MSVILDALNKAEASKTAAEAQPVATTGARSFKMPKVPVMGKGSSSKRVVILLVLIVVAGAALGLIKIYKSSILATATDAVHSQVASATDSQSVAAAKAKQVEAVQGNTKKAQELRRQAAQQFLDGHFDESIKLYTKYLEASPSDAAAFNELGLVLKRDGRLQEAREAYGKAIATQPAMPEAYNNLAVVQMAVGEFTEAKKSLQKAMEIKADYIDPYLHMGLVLEKSGDIKGSVGYYGTFLKISDGKIDRRIRLQVESRMARLNEELNVAD
jgi:Flp pilus assembly protein TadD